MKLVLVPLCILGLLLASGCSRSSPTGTPETIAETREILTNTKISAGAEPILEYPAAQPHLEWLSALKPQDKEVLLSRYRNEAQLTNKLALTIALSYVGDEEVAEEFKKTLLKTPFDYVLDFNHEHVILSTVEGLGRIARTHDSVLPFLRQGTDPRFWKQNAPWKTHLGERQYGVVAGSALSAIAISGAPDAREIFEQVKANPYVTDAEGSGWALNGSVVEAVFLADLLQQRGFDPRKGIYTSEGGREEWRAWTGTENGKKWVSWSRQWKNDHPRESGNPFAK